MGFTFQEFPNADMYDSDLRELLKEMRELRNRYNLVLTKELKNFIREKLKDIFANCLYDAPNERLILKFEGYIISDGDVHIYDESNSSISIEEGGDEICQEK